MKVFLSWSGETSKQVASALRDWLPNVIQAIDPWMSSEDIDKGARWSSDIAKELATTKAGIICVTPDNGSGPWLNFEAGALSKTVDKEMVCPYLFRLRPSDLTGPLVQFQASEATKKDTQRLVETLNKVLQPKPLPERKLLESFEMWWEKLELTLASIKADDPPHHPIRSLDEMLQEVLSIVRDQSRTSLSILTLMSQVRSATPTFTGMYDGTFVSDGSEIWGIPNLIYGKPRNVPVLSMLQFPHHGLVKPDETPNNPGDGTTADPEAPQKDE